MDPDVALTSQDSSLMGIFRQSLWETGIAPRQAVAKSCSLRLMAVPGRFHEIVTVITALWLFVLYQVFALRPPILCAALRLSSLQGIVAYSYCSRDMDG